MDKKYCGGCVDDFHNGHNPYGVKECWSLKTAKLVTKWRAWAENRLLCCHSALTGRNGELSRIEVARYEQE